MKLLDYYYCTSCGAQWGEHPEIAPPEECVSCGECTVESAEEGGTNSENGDE